MTRADDIRLACSLGVDAIGMVFAQRSPRRLAIAQAAVLRTDVAAGIETVALFMDNAADEVNDVIAQVRPTLLQFHGLEDAAFCRGFGLPYMKAIAMGEEGGQGIDWSARYPDATALLLDSHAVGGAGGSGHTFDWSRIPARSGKPFLLAGGLVPGNVFEAVTVVQPWGVDVSSGIEGAPGIKDEARMRRFVEEVRRADLSR
ncbi:phosphoribosylanthranilate isomerase [Lysobacter sp. S4-A87]|nr:phosphoribosylanthranilate isomerase [Lysobacter sp. S4-A87]